MKIKNNYIFGSGISALIAKYYNPSYVVITPDEEIGGQIKKHKNLLMTFHIHNHPLTKALLDELKIVYKEKRLRIYYVYNDKILESLDNKQRLNFIKNKMSEWNYDNNSVDFKDLNLSTTSNYLDILECDINELIKKLQPKEYIKGSIKLVNNNRKFFVYQDENKKLVTKNYDKIINTIPANLFFPMLYNYKNNYHFNYLPATFCLSSNKSSFMEDESMYYFYDSNLPYNRCQPYAGGYVYEATGIVDEKVLSKYIENITAVENRYVGVIRNENVDDFKHIKFLGRLAQWDSSIKIQNVIEKAKLISNIER